VEIRAIGSAFLGLNEEDAAIPTSPQHESLLRELRSAMGVARQKLGDDAVKKELADLRADHTERWLCTLRRMKLLEVDPFCRALLRDHPKAEDAAELHRLGGSLAEILTHTGWIDASGMPRVPESILRARYTMFWTSTVYGLDTCERAAAPVCFGLTSLPLPADEVRALIAFLIAHPVVWVTAPTDDAAAAADRRRLVYIDRLEQLDEWADPSGKTHTYTRDYPVDLARGALYFRLGQWANAAEALRRAVDANHSDFRARNWLLATLEKLQG